MKNSRLRKTASNANQVITDLYANSGYNVDVKEVIQYDGFEVAKMVEHHPNGPDTSFDLIIANGKVYNSNLDDMAVSLQEN